LYRKDLIRSLASSDAVERWRPDELVRRPSFVPRTKKAIELLTEFQSGKIHIAFVVGEYGNLLGLVTLDDIVRTLIPEGSRTP
jgi:magnesium and cobalt transporter